MTHVALRSRWIWVTLFALFFAYVEASVVVYLRAIYYPEGFTFPLTMVRWEHLFVELGRELATLLMLVAVGALAGTTAWQRFGWFMVAFGVWDIGYYIWLKLLLRWPHTVFDWDVLFLLPLPWIAPVIAPLLISVLLLVCGAGIVRRTAERRYFRPGFLSWILGGSATLLILYSFILDIPATLQGKMPEPYHYELLAVGLGLYAYGYLLACRPPTITGTS